MKATDMDIKTDTARTSREHVMDPNATLAAIRSNVYGLLDSGKDDGYEALAIRLAENVEALDDWISVGGFLPDAWSAAAPAKESL